LTQIYQTCLAKVRKCGERTGSMPVTRVCKGVLPGLGIQQREKPYFLFCYEIWVARNLDRIIGICKDQPC